MKKIIKTIIFSLLLFTFIAPPIVSATVSATNDMGMPAIQETKKGYDASAKKLGYETSANKEDTVSKLTGTRDTIIKTIIGLAGVFFLILIIWGGYDWMFSGGNEERVSKAKERIKMAITGLIIVLAAYILTSFILDALFKDTIAES